MRTSVLVQAKKIRENSPPLISRTLCAKLPCKKLKTNFLYNPSIKIRTMSKKPFLLAFCFGLLLSQNLEAQTDVIRFSPCENEFIKNQADSLKQLFTKGGFIVLREAMVAMESEYELPVIIPMTQGTWYQVVFIGDIRSKTYEVRMYDYDEKQVVYKKNQWGDVDGNIITYSYIPRVSEFHMIKPVQVNKVQKKNLCGYFMLLKKVVQQ